jgi:RNA polymerase sigma-54 factor
MALTQRLDLRQSQALVMTPQLQQAIKLLQMSNLDLQEFVQQELESNPLLEAAEPDYEPPLAETASLSGGLTATSATPEADVFAHDAPLDTDFDNVWAGETGGGTTYGEFGEGAEAYIPAGSGSLRDHLLAQMQCDLLEPMELMIGAALIDLLDDSGFLPADLELARTQLGAPSELFARVIAQVQQCDPSGIFACDLAECLSIQLRERNRLDPAMAILVQNLPLVASGAHQRLQQLCGVDAEDLTDMLAELRRLNPRPAQGFADAAVAQTLIPEVLLRPLAGGGWQVELNAESLPRVLANESYYTRIAAASQAKADKDYIQDRWQHANWLVKALHQRATTILKVATEIVRRQDDFFVYGVAQLHPLTLKQIAESVGMHESTISRVTAHKYIATPRGMFELKYFFSNALTNSNGGEAHAAAAVRHRIKHLIEAETSGQIMADDTIAALLQREGITIARRTVAKYREALGIASSAARRRAAPAQRKA